VGRLASKTKPLEFESLPARQLNLNFGALYVVDTGLEVLLEIFENLKKSKIKNNGEQK